MQGASLYMPTAVGLPQRHSPLLTSVLDRPDARWLCPCDLVECNNGAHCTLEWLWCRVGLDSPSLYHSTVALHVWRLKKGCETRCLSLNFAVVICVPHASVSGLLDLYNLYLDGR